MELAVARSGAALRCSYCGAPLPAGPDAVAVVCPSCGRVNWLRGGGRLYAVQSQPLARVEEGFRGFAARDPDLRGLGVEPARVEVVYIPFYEARGRGWARYHYSGYVTRTRTVRRGGETRTVTERIPFSISGVFERVFRGLLLAKRSLGEEAADELAEAYLRSRAEPVEVERLELERGVAVLAADVEQGEAERRLRGAGCDWLRARLEEHVRSEAAARYGGAVTVTSRRIECRVELEQARLVLLPLAKVFYIVEDRIYRAYFAAWSMEPLLREEPMTGLQRGFLAGLAGFLSAAAGAGGLALGDLAAAAVGLVGGAALGFLVARAALQPVRLEKGGAQSWISSIPETVTGG